MARMNWDRASREYRYARATDYMAREDDLDRQLIDKERARPTKVTSKQATKSHKAKSQTTGKSKRGGAFGSGRLGAQMRQHLKTEAPRLGVSKARLVELREEALRQGWPLDAVLDGRAIAHGGTIRPNADPVSSPPLRPSGKVIKSRGAQRPPRPRQRLTQHPTTPPKSKPPTKLSKKQRTEAQDQRRGISVDQLVDERRQRARESNRLAARARDLGITTKELRQRLEHGGQ